MDVNRIRVATAIGFSEGTRWTINAPANGDIDIDNDGVMSAHGFTVDLSHIASKALGKQVPMTSIVRLHHIQFGLRPVDDVTDNEESAWFGGRLFFHPPTDHVVEAMKMARQMNNATEETQADSDSLLLGADKRYTALRYGWTENDGVNEVAFPTTAPMSGIDWSLNTIKGAYDVITAPDQVNALFTGRFGDGCSLSWMAAQASGAGDNDPIPIGDRTFALNHLSLPLLRGLVEFSSVDESGSVDDDYKLYLDIDFTLVGGF